MRYENTLRDANKARQLEWDKDDKITAAYRGNELAGEVGEACNIIKKLERERMGIRGSRASIGDLADELADVVICVDLIAMQYGINLDHAISRKFNWTSEKYGLETRFGNNGTVSSNEGTRK
jgi:NTP pyrophosphatase (non-canonical NTP hydrolase)